MTVPGAHRVLAGFRVLSLALDLPGPAALMRLRAMGAECTKFEPPSGDPMRLDKPTTYAALREGVKVREVDLNSPGGIAALHKELDKTDVLLSSLGASAMAKLGLSWQELHSRHPMLCHVAIVAGPGDEAEVPGAIMASEAVLKAALHLNARYQGGGETPRGIYLEVAMP
jgi:crotonobetainyl-CoA:carnitine CoA-transferase CaiB-like acyl-CoA transferase